MNEGSRLEGSSVAEQPPLDDRLRIYTSLNWQLNQRKWLERLAKQLVFEVIDDREFVNTCFAEHGGAKRLDSVLDKRLDTVLEELSQALWA